MLGKDKLRYFKLLKVVKSTVYHVVKKLKELDKSEDHFRSGRPRTALTKKVIKVFRERVRRNAKSTARQMA